jgi:hypothetical protein
MTETAISRRPVPGDRRQLLALLVLGLAVVVSAVVVLRLLVHGDGGGTTVKPGSGPVLLSRPQLESFVHSAPGPVYWAGPKDGVEYEVTTTPSGRTYVRYLPAGVSAGDSRADFLVVGTYPQAHAFADLQHAASGPRSISFHIDHGGVMVYAFRRPTSVYVGYPGRKYQVEVYDPSGDAARKLVATGKIVPVR